MGRALIVREKIELQGATRLMTSFSDEGREQLVDAMAVLV